MEDGRRKRGQGARVEERVRKDAMGEARIWKTGGKKG